DVVPQRPPPRRGERLDLHLALAVPDGHPRAVLIGHDELDLVVGADRYLQAAEGDPFALWERLPRVPGTAAGRGARRGLLLVGPLLVELIIGQPVVTDLGLVATPTKHSERSF